MPASSLLTRRRFLQASSLAAAGLATTAYLASRPTSQARGRILVVGGGAAGLDIAARLHRALAHPDITVIDPAQTHFYQPGFTLLAAGVFSPTEIARPQSSLIPSGVRYLPDSVTSIDPQANRLTTLAHGALPYDYLVLTPGLEMDFNAIEGITRETLGHANVHSIYDFKSAQNTFKAIENLSARGGRALFTDTWTKLKCGGAPKKINMIAEDYTRRHNTRDRVHFQFISATDHLFNVQPFRARLEQIYAERNIPYTFNHRIKSIDTAARRVTFTLGAAANAQTVTHDFDFLHIVPPMSAPAFLRDSPLATDPQTGRQLDWIPTHKSTLVHPRFPNVFVAGDVAGLPTSKTSAAIRIQAPVLAANLLAAMDHRPAPASYNGYTACPFVTEYGKVLMAEFDYSKKPAPTLPFIDYSREHRPGWLLKRYVLRPLYFDLMLKGLA